MLFLFDINPYLQYIQFDTIGYRVFLSVLAIIVSIIIFNKADKKKLNRFIGEKIRFIAAGILVSGIILYMIGFWDEGSKGNILTLLFRATLSSLEMFVSHSDLLEVRHSMHENALYMFLFALIHFLAVLLSAILVLPLIVYISHSKRVLRKLKCKRLFIFWGENTNSFILAENIIQTQKDKNYKILFIETPLDNTESDSSIHFTHLFSGSLVKNEKMEHITEMGALLLTSQVSELQRIKGQSLKEVFADARLSFLYQCIEKQNIEDVKIFFLSNNQELNIRNASAFVATTEKKDSPILRKKIAVYCHSYYTDMCVTYSYGSLYKRSLGHNNINLIIVDTARLAVVELKNHQEYHPVRFVDVDTETATAKSPFTALIIGFDESGQEALKFLYEFGTFIGADGKKNPLKCYVLSSHIDEQKSKFYMEYPALENNPEVELLNYDHNTPAFWKWMKTIINDVNYVVVNQGNDAENLHFTTEMIQFVYSKRTANMQNFKMFVRSYEIEYYKELSDIAAYYNITNPQWGEKIVVFGTQKDIFTYKNVIEQEAVYNSVFFYETYAKLVGEKDWMARFKSLSRTYAQHQELAFHLNQDMSNFWHAKTKTFLAGVSDDDQGKQRLEQLLQCVQHVQI